VVMGWRQVAKETGGMSVKRGRRGGRDVVAVGYMLCLECGLLQHAACHVMETGRTDGGRLRAVQDAFGLTRDCVS
jgi:hypothetical protein